MKKRLISLIPFKKVTVKTSLRLDEVVSLFSSAISDEWDPLLGTPPKNIKKLQGDISQEGFKIRITDYHRKSLTYMVGRFIISDGRVEIEMYLTGLMYLVSLIFICFGILLFFLNIYISSKDFMSKVMPLAFIVFGFAGLILEADQLDLQVGNLLEKYIAE